MIPDRLDDSLVGNETDLRYQNEVGDCEFKWMREYGSAWRRAGCFGVSVSCSVTVLNFVNERKYRQIV